MPIFLTSCQKQEDDKLLDDLNIQKEDPNTNVYDDDSDDYLSSEPINFVGEYEIIDNTITLSSLDLKNNLTVDFLAHCSILKFKNLMENTEVQENFFPITETETDLNFDINDNVITLEINVTLHVDIEEIQKMEGIEYSGGEKIELTNTTTCEVNETGFKIKLLKNTVNDSIFDENFKNPVDEEYYPLVLHTIDFDSVIATYDVENRIIAFVSKDTSNVLYTLEVSEYDWTNII